MTDLSPAAKTVSDEFWNPGTHVGLNYRLVMAMRAIANEVVPVPIVASTPEEHWALLGIKNKILSIADEIEDLYGTHKHYRVIDD
jgi:hypothetical protein